METKEMLNKIKEVVANYANAYSLNKELEVTSEGNYPILEEETMLLDENGVTRFYGKKEQETFAWDELSDMEVEVVYDTLEYNDLV